MFRFGLAAWWNWEAPCSCCKIPLRKSTRMLVLEQRLCRALREQWSACTAWPIWWLAGC